MSSTRAVIDVWINGQPAGRAELHREQEWMYARSEHAVKPDPEWSHTDSSGHYHAWSGEDKLPTLRRNSVEMPCDGSCGGVCEGEGYTRTEWRCAVCEEVIEPGYIPDWEARGPGTPVPGLRSWTAKVRGPASVLAGLQVDGRSQVSVVMDRRSEELRIRYFGFAVVADWVVEGGFAGADMCTITLAGTSDLGHGKVLEPVAVADPA